MYNSPSYFEFLLLFTIVRPDIFICHHHASSISGYCYWENETCIFQKATLLIFEHFNGTLSKSYYIFPYLGDQQILNNIAWRFCLINSKVGLGLHRPHPCELQEQCSTASLSATEVSWGTCNFHRTPNPTSARAPLLPSILHIGFPHWIFFEPRISQIKIII